MPEKMKPAIKRAAVTLILSALIGCLGTAVIANSENGYVAGFIILPLLFVYAVLSLILFIIGLVNITKPIGPFLLLAAILIPSCFFGSALLAKQFGVGAYREDPMIPMIPETSNIVLLKKGSTNDQINSFWNETLSTKKDNGTWPLPGIRGIGRLGPRDGHDVIEFSFFESATPDQRQFVYSKVRNSPLVFELRENVATREYIDDDVPESNAKFKKQ